MVRSGCLVVPTRWSKDNCSTFCPQSYCDAHPCNAPGTCEAIPGGEGTEHWVQQVLQMVALVWYFVPRFKLTQRGAQAFGRRRTVLSQNLQRPSNLKTD